MPARFTAAQSRRGRKAARSPLPALGSPLFLIHLYLFLSPQTLLFSSTGMHWPEEATPLRRGEERDALLLNKTSQLLNPPPPPLPAALPPGRSDPANSPHAKAAAETRQTQRIPGQGVVLGGEPRCAPTSSEVAALPSALFLFVLT